MDIFELKKRLVYLPPPNPKPSPSPGNARKAVR
jgi:hypothetical protein